MFQGFYFNMEPRLNVMVKALERGGYVFDFWPFHFMQRRSHA